MSKIAMICYDRHDVSSFVHQALGTNRQIKLGDNVTCQSRSPVMKHLKGRVMPNRPRSHDILKALVTAAYKPTSLFTAVFYVC